VITEGGQIVGGSKLEAGAHQEVQLRLTFFDDADAEYPSIEICLMSIPWSLYIVEALSLPAQLRPIRGFQLNLLTYVQQSTWAVPRRAWRGGLHDRDPRLGMGKGGPGRTLAGIVTCTNTSSRHHMAEEPTLDAVVVMQWSSAGVMLHPVVSIGSARLARHRPAHARANTCESCTN